LFFLGAHIHTADLRSPLSPKFPDVNYTIFLAPSVSPFHQNNPGYTVLDLDIRERAMGFLPSYFELKTQMRFFQMSEYTILRKESFITTDLEKLLGINLLDP
jgi:hypothetical protein